MGELVDSKDRFKAKSFAAGCTLPGADPQAPIKRAAPRWQTLFYLIGVVDGIRRYGLPEFSEPPTAHSRSNIISLRPRKPTMS